MEKEPLDKPLFVALVNLLIAVSALGLIVVILLLFA